MLNMKAKYAVNQEMDGRKTGSVLGVDKKQNPVSTTGNKLKFG